MDDWNRWWRRRLMCRRRGRIDSVAMTRMFDSCGGGSPRMSGRANRPVTFMRRYTGAAVCRACFLRCNAMGGGRVCLSRRAMGILVRCSGTGATGAHVMSFCSAMVRGRVMRRSLCMRRGVCPMHCFRMRCRMRLVHSSHNAVALVRAYRKRCLSGGRTTIRSIALPDRPHMPEIRARTERDRGAGGPLGSGGET
jgi:hypothetical protein